MKTCLFHFVWREITEKVRNALEYSCNLYRCSSLFLHPRRCLRNWDCPPFALFFAQILENRRNSRNDRFSSESLQQLSTTIAAHENGLFALGPVLTNGLPSQLYMSRALSEINLLSTTSCETFLFWHQNNPMIVFKETKFTSWCRLPFDKWTRSAFRLRSVNRAFQKLCSRSCAPPR